MSTLQEHIAIDAPVERVWEVLADFGGIAQWNPVLRSSRLLTEANGGVGSLRHCEIRAPGKTIPYVRERVAAWEPGRGYTWDIIETNTPMKRARNRFELASAGGSTRATFHLDYEMKFGLLGRLMGALAKGKMRGSARKTLEGLKARAEAPTSATANPNPGAGNRR